MSVCERRWQFTKQWADDSTRTLDTEKDASPIHVIEIISIPLVRIAWASVFWARLFWQGCFERQSFGRGCSGRGVFWAGCFERDSSGNNLSECLSGGGDSDSGGVFLAEVSLRRCSCGGVSGGGGSGGDASGGAVGILRAVLFSKR